MLLLTNAVYFSEAWTVAFKAVPEPVPFTLSNGEQVQVKMMTRSSHEIVTAAFKFTKIVPDMTMFLVTLRYSVSTLLMLILIIYFQGNVKCIYKGGGATRLLAPFTGCQKKI